MRMWEEKMKHDNGVIRLAASNNEVHFLWLLEQLNFLFFKGNSLGQKKRLF